MFSAFSFSLLHVVTSNSCVYSLKTPQPCLFSLCTGLLYGLNPVCYTDRLQIYSSECYNMFSFSQLSSTALFFLPGQPQILLQHLKYTTGISSFDDNTDRIMLLNPEHFKRKRFLSHPRSRLNILKRRCSPTALNALLYINKTGTKGSSLINVLCISQDKLLQCSEHTVSIWRI